MQRDTNNEVNSLFGEETVAVNETDRRFKNARPTLTCIDNVEMDVTTQSEYWLDSMLNSVKVFRVQEEFNVDTAIKYMKQLHHSCITGHAMARFDYYMSSKKSLKLLLDEAMS